MKRDEGGEADGHRRDHPAADLKHRVLESIDTSVDAVDASAELHPKVPNVCINTSEAAIHTARQVVQPLVRPGCSRSLHRRQDTPPRPTACAQIATIR